MNKTIYGALERLIEEIQETRKAECLMKDCVVNQSPMGNDLDLVKSWMNAIKKEYNY